VNQEKNPSLRDQAYDYLLQELHRQKLSPGDMINRRTIAAQLHVSVAPVLEAMLQLEAEGLLETVPRRGTRVRSLTPQEVGGHLVVREALECQAARLYCGAPIRRQEKKLLRLAADLDASDGRQMQTWHKEVVFHRLLVALADCTLLLEEFDRVMRTSLFLQVNLFIPPKVRPRLVRHTALVRKLKTKDPDAAECCMRNHLHHGKEGII
jgi:GntR family transcriptional regulator, rspAB operon transcriptional repressor